MLSGSADPYHIAQQEVTEAVRKLQGMHEEWKQLLRGDTAKGGRFPALHADIAGDLLLIGDDLRDVSATIEMVEHNPGNFPIGNEELNKRKGFVKACHKAVQEIQESVNSRQAVDKIQADQRRTQIGLSDEESRNAVRENEVFMDRQRQDQAHIIQQQDEELAQISKVAQRLGENARAMNTELEGQRRMLEELSENIDKETDKLNSVMKRMGRLLKTSDHKLMCVVVALFALFFVLLFLLIKT